MTELNFFTPITYSNRASMSTRDLFLEKVDDYFYMGGKKAHVLHGLTKKGQRKAIVSEVKSSLLVRVGKVFSYFTIIIPLLMLIAKAALRSGHRFKVIDPKQKLEKGVNISDDTAVKIQSLMPKILRLEKDDELEWLLTGNNLVFKLAKHPQLVFKIPRPNRFFGKDKLPAVENSRTHSRFENMVKAKEICIVNELGLLIIPHAKKIIVNADGNDYAFIVEESLDFNPHQSANEELYHKYSTELNETARQLATFVAKTGFNDVAWRNIPILKEKMEFHGSRRVGLIDLEHMKSVVHGFIGDYNRSSGLIGCVSEEQIDIVIEEAFKQGAITEKQAQEAKDCRLQELESDKKLRTLYEKNGILTGKEPIKVDLDSLGLDLTEEDQMSVPVEEKGELKWQQETVTLRKITEEVIAEMNRLIQNKSDQASAKGKRYFVLNTKNYPLLAYTNLGLPTDVCAYRATEEELKQLWLTRIIAALVDKGYIFKLDKINGHGYFIQA